jgi:small subunit ribosomal protein S20
MAITKSAKKAIRVSARKRVFNLRRKRAMSETIKKFKKLVEAKKLKEAKELEPAVYQAVDKAAKRGVIKPNTAARKKSRLTAMLVSKT